MMAGTLVVVFLIHTIAFLALYLRRRQTKYLLLVVTFIVLVIAYSLIMLDLVYTIDLFIFHLEVFYLLKGIAAILTFFSIYYAVKERLTTSKENKDKTEN